MADLIPAADPATPAAPVPAAPPPPTGFTTGPLMDGVDMGDAAAPSAAWDTFRFAPVLQDTNEIAREDRYIHGEFAPRGAGSMSPSEFQFATKPIPSPTLSADAANQQYGIEGRLTFDKPTPLAVAQMQHEATLDRIKREEISAREPGGIWSAAEQMGVGFLGQALDPTNIALTMIPPLGEARYASWLAEAGLGGVGGRTIARLAAGAGAGALGTALEVPLQYSIAQRQGQDYGMSQALLDIAYGGASFGAFHAAGGLVHDMIAGAPAALARPTRQAVGAPIPPEFSNEAVLATLKRPDIAAVATADAQTHQAALQTAMAQLDSGRPVEVSPYFEAWHGSPHEFSAFQDEAIGTGEGAQAYGVGHYLAEAPGVASSYKLAGAPDWAGSRQQKLAQAALDMAEGNGLSGAEARTEAINELHRQMLAAQANKPLRYDLQDAINNFDSVVGPNTPGHLYKVAVAGKPEHFLDWDKPLSEQSPEVQKALAEHWLAHPEVHATMTGRQIYEAAGKTLEGDSGPEAASNALQRAGIPGIRYLDQQSRTAGEGSRNYVVFDPKTIRILEKNGQPHGVPAGPNPAQAFDLGPVRTIGEMRLAVERLNQKIAEFNAAGLPNIAALFEEKLRALGYEPAGTPAALSAEGAAGGAAKSSSTATPPERQALPSQVSTRAAPEGSSTYREKAPSTLQGPMSTLTLGEMDRATNRKIIQGSADLKELHNLAVATRDEVNKRLFDLVRDVPGAELVAVRAKDLPGLEAKAQSRPPQTISDYLGGRITLDSPEAMSAMLDQLRSSGRLLEVEDFLGGEGKQGYRAVHVQMDLGNGMSIELQLVPKEIAEVQSEAHAIRQPIKRLAEKAEHTPEEKARVMAAFAKSKAIFDKAWGKIAAKWGYGGAAEKAATIPAKFIKNDVAVLPGGEEVKVRYAIVDAKDLTASQLPSMEPNPKYPAALQPRDRTRSASAVQVRTIAQKMNPKLLGENPNASDGAPIVGPDGVVESGNGRVMAIHMAYAEKMPTGEKYKAYLAEQGYPIDHLEEPVLVRIRDQAMTTEERAQFGRKANERTTLGMGTAEQAKSDAAALSDHILDLHRGGDIGLASNRDFVKAFQRDIAGSNEGAAMVDKDGGLTVKGRQRIEAAILAKAYDDPGILAALLEDPESNIKAIGKAITDVSPRWALMRKEAAAGEINPKVDISRDLLDAVNLVRKARDQGIKINDLVNQADVFSGRISPESEAMLNIFFKPAEKKGEVPFTKPRSMDNIAKRLDDYVREARKSSGGPGLFGGEDVVGPQEILRSAGREGQAGEQPGLFGQPGGSTGTGPRDGAGPAGRSGGPDSGQGVIGEGPAAGPGGGGAPLGSPGYPPALADALHAAAGDALPEEQALTQIASAAVKDPMATLPDPQTGTAIPPAVTDAMAVAEASVKQAKEAGLLSPEELAQLEAADKGIKDAQAQGKLIDAAAACLSRVA